MEIDSNKESCTSEMSNPQLTYSERIENINLKWDLELKSYMNLDVDINIRNMQGKCPLHIAIENGNHKAVAYLLNRGAYPDTTDVKGDSPLHIAAKKNFCKIMDLLLTYGADVNFQNIYHKCTPLHYAVEYPQNLKAIKLLLSRNANVELYNYEYCTPLHWAVRDYKLPLDVVKELLKASINFRKERSIFSTVLHSAVQNSSSRIVNELLEAGASVFARKFSNTPLHIAVRKSPYATRVVKLLLNKGAGVNDFNSSGYTPLHVAASRQNHFKAHVIKQLIAKGALVNAIARNIDCRTPIHYAIINPSCNASTVLLMMKKSKRLNNRDNFQNTYLHYAVVNNEFLIVNELLRRRVNVNLRNYKGNTALHIAVSKGKASKECVDKLLCYGVKVNVKNNDGNTALHLAVQCHNMSIEVIKALLKHGASPNALNSEHDTPLHFAARNNEFSADVLQILTTHNAYANTRNQNKDTPLHVACQNEHSHLKGVEVLLKNRANVFVANRNNFTPLELIPYPRGDTNVSTLLIAYLCLSKSGRKLLLEKLQRNLNNHPSQMEYIQMQHSICVMELTEMEKCYLSDDFTLFDLVTKEITVANVPGIDITCRIIALMKENPFPTYLTIMQHKVELLVRKQFRVFNIMHRFLMEMNISIDRHSALEISTYLTTEECFNLFVKIYEI